MKSPACVRCGAALETGATPDTPPPRKHPSTPALALVVAAGLVGAFVGAWASALAPVLGPLGAASVGLAVSTGMGLVAIVARFSA